LGKGPIAKAGGETVFGGRTTATNSIAPNDSMWSNVFRLPPGLEGGSEGVVKAASAALRLRCASAWTTSCCVVSLRRVTVGLPLGTFQEIHQGRENLNQEVTRVASTLKTRVGLGLQIIEFGVFVLGLRCGVVCGKIVHS